MLRIKENIKYINISLERKTIGEQIFSLPGNFLESCFLLSSLNEEKRKRKDNHDEERHADTTVEKCWSIETDQVRYGYADQQHEKDC